MDAIQSGYIAELNEKVEAQQKEIDELKSKRGTIGSMGFVPRYKR